MSAHSVQRRKLRHPRRERLFHHYRHVLGILPIAYGHQKSRLDCFQHPIWFLQVMPMGLTGSLNTFQSLMECVFLGLAWKITVPYLDEWIIFSETAEQHLERLRQVLKRFRSANLKINPTECEFFRTRVPFLGHIISKDGLEADPEKVAAVKNFPIPTSPTEVKSFLGLCSYYRR